MGQGHSGAQTIWRQSRGGVGTGKTHLLAAVANALLSTTARPLYCVVPDFLAFLRESFEAGQSDSCSKRFEIVRNAGVLLLDDLGAEKETEWTQEQLYRVINHRYNEGLPTLIASNVPLDEIDPRIASRLRDIRLGQVIVLTGPDYRARKAMTTANPPADRPSAGPDGPAYMLPTMDAPLPPLIIPRTTPQPPTADYVSGWYVAASYWRAIADRATSRLIHERFYFAASLFGMLAAALFLTVALMAAR